VLRESGRAAEAQQTIEKALARAHARNDRLLLMQVEIEAARCASALSKSSEAVKTLKQVIGEASQAGLRLYALEARLALGQITHARNDLHSLATEAEAGGFLLIAHKAARSAEK
jgi:hypothetical protein